jgi:hypothetical protein
MAELCTLQELNNNRERDLAVGIFSVFCIALSLVACGDPHDTKVPADI